MRGGRGQVWPFALSPMMCDAYDLISHDSRFEDASCPSNPLRLKSIHHVKFVVGNARQAAYYYRKGLRLLAVRLQRARDR